MSDTTRERSGAAEQRLSSFTLQIGGRYWANIAAHPTVGLAIINEAMMSSTLLPEILILD